MTATVPAATDAGRADSLFFASLLPLRERALREPFNPPIEVLLERLVPAFNTDLRRILHQSGALPVSINPANWEDSTVIIALRSVLDARATCAGAGLDHSTIAALTTPEAVAALEARVGKGWSSQRLAMILADLRRLAILEHGACHPLVGKRRAFHAGQPKRDIDHRVFPPKDYLRGAVAVATLASILQLTNRAHGRILLRNATLLALAAVSHLRRSEYHLLDVDDVRRRESADGAKLVSVSIDMRKTGNSRIVVVRDARVTSMILGLTDAPHGTPLFRNADGSRISCMTVSEIFWQMGDLAVGEGAGANVLRRARMLDKGSAQQRSTDLGQSPLSNTAENHYRGNMMAAGLKVLRSTNAEAFAKIKARRAALG